MGEGRTYSTGSRLHLYTGLPAIFPLEETQLWKTLLQANPHHVYHVLSSLSSSFHHSSESQCSLQSLRSRQEPQTRLGIFQSKTDRWKKIQKLGHMAARLLLLKKAHTPPQKCHEKETFFATNSSMNSVSCCCSCAVCQNSISIKRCLSKACLLSAFLKTKWELYNCIQLHN